MHDGRQPTRTILNAPSRPAPRPRPRPRPPISREGEERELEETSHPLPLLPLPCLSPSPSPPPPLPLACTEARLPTRAAFPRNPLPRANDISCPPGTTNPQQVGLAGVLVRARTGRATRRVDAMQRPPGADPQMPYQQPIGCLPPDAYMQAYIQMRQRVLAQKVAAASGNPFFFQAPCAPPGHTPAAQSAARPSPAVDPTRATRPQNSRPQLSDSNTKWLFCGPAPGEARRNPTAADG
jgi:hypothetical protein